MSEVKRYADRDIMQLDRDGNHYCNHVLSMTREGLHDKSDIAAELAFRDAELERVTAERDALRQTLENSYTAEDHERLVAKGQALNSKYIEKLEQRLTAADEREDALGILVPEAELALKALNVAVSVYDVEMADSARRGLRLIIAALKPAQMLPADHKCIECDSEYCHGVCVERGDSDDRLIG
jgi:hypothetical protein